jgi:hypothetical protein
VTAALKTVFALAVDAADEAWVVAGALCLLVGVALIYVPAAVIIGGVLLCLIGVGRMRA